MMTDAELKWTLEDTKTLLNTPVFDVLAQEEVSAAGPTGTYVALEAPDWVMVVPVLGKQFVMVRQWRHAARCLTVEFPGGVRDKGEDPARTAARELLEETGFRAGKLTALGSCSPNPALFRNTFYCFLAEDLTAIGAQHLDPDELLTYELHPIDEVISAFGSPLYSHALMGTALAFYLQKASRTCHSAQREGSAASASFHPTAEELWKAAGLTGPLDAWCFGGDPDGLAALVLAGKKRATSSAFPLYALENEPVPRPGSCSVLLDGAGRALCVLRTTRVEILPFGAVTPRHAALEGEGDLSLAHWRRVHRDFFTAELAAAGLPFGEDTNIVCEEFEMIE